jgi:3-oxoacyl-[acyl-carrier protein] reductase
MENLKKILITGASRGLGAVLAREFGKERVSIAILSRSLSGLNEVKSQIFNARCEVFAADLVNVGKLADLIESVIIKMGGIDVVIHAAGGGLGFKDDLINSEQLDTLIKLNFSSVVEINRIIIPHMKNNNGGNLVHVGSIASTEAVGSVGYNSAKAALAAYVRSIGRQLYSHNIIATGILPGGFISEGNAMWRLKERNLQAYEAFIAERLPRKKMGDALEIVPLVKFLCSSAASMMGGCMVPIDAGEGRSYAL